VPWTVESWTAVNENCVRDGFIKAWGDEAVSGDSDYVHDDTFSEMEAEEIPKEILNATDSFQCTVRWRISWIWIVSCLINNELYFYLTFVITFDLPLIPFWCIPRMFIFCEFRTFLCR
jgi:hypothetical protein